MDERILDHEGEVDAKMLNQRRCNDNLRRVGLIRRRRHSHVGVVLLSNVRVDQASDYGALATPKHIVLLNTTAAQDIWRCPSSNQRP